MKDNVMIAEFMGVYSEVQGSLKYRYKNEWHKDYDLLYHRSWDWLMPVVMRCYESDIKIEVGDITHGLLDCDLESTHKAVVEFIKQKTL